MPALPRKVQDGPTARMPRRSPDRRAGGGAVGKPVDKAHETSRETTLWAWWETELFLTANVCILPPSVMDARGLCTWHCMERAVETAVSSALQRRPVRSNTTRRYHGIPPIGKSKKKHFCRVGSAMEFNSPARGACPHQAPWLRHNRLRETEGWDSVSLSHPCELRVSPLG